MIWLPVPPLKVAQTLWNSFSEFLTPDPAPINLVNRIFIGLTDGTSKPSFGEYQWPSVKCRFCPSDRGRLAAENIIEWRIPLFYLATVAVLTLLFGGIKGSGVSLSVPVFHLFSGGLMLGAFFMATDYTTTPMTKKGRIIFGIGCGLLTVVIRLVGGYPEGVSYSILFMNVMTPLIDALTVPKAFGKVKK